MPVLTVLHTGVTPATAALALLLAIPTFQTPGIPGSQALPPPTSTGAITGVVVDGTTGAAVAGAVVAVTRAGQPAGEQSRQLTDAKGRFAFVNLPAGDNYRLAASRFGYFDGQHGRDAPSNSAPGFLTLTDGQWLANARIVLWRPAVVGGVVTDEHGDPVVGVYVRVLAQRRIAGQTHLVASASTTTDDRGRYRIPGLRPGRVFVSVPTIHWTVPATMSSAAIAGISEQLATTREVPAETALDLGDTSRLVLGNFPIPPPSADGRPLAYPTTFHPNAGSVSEATTIDLRHGEERDNVDIRLTAVPAARVSGTVVAPPEAMAQLNLRLLPAGLEGLGLGGESATTVVAADGSFQFLNVPAGNYFVDVVRGYSELVEAGASPPLDGLRNQGYPPRPPGVTGSGFSSESLPSGPAGVSFMTRSSTAAGRFVNGQTGGAKVVVSGGDVTGIVVRLRPAVTIRGHVVFEHDARQPETPRPGFISLRAEPANGDPRLGMPRQAGPPVDRTDDIEIPGLQPGRYLLRANLSAPWILKSVVVNGKDVTDTPIDTSGEQDLSAVVTVTNAGATVSGLVVDAQGQLAAGAAVVLFPADPARWSDFGITSFRIKTMSASSAGTFKFSPQVAGDYLVVSVPANDIDAWQEPDFFKKAAARATRVTVGWGETKTVDLRVADIR